MEIKSYPHYVSDDILNVCVTIGEVFEGQRHVGFLFRDLISGQVKFLHLAWFNELRYDSAPDKKYVWLDIPFDEYNQLHFQVFLNTVYEQNSSGIPYGITVDGIDFGSDGSMLKEEEHAGLTCATFVLRILHSQGYEIIDIQNWTERADDEAWQAQILDYLSAVAPKKFIDFQRTQVGALRFRPEEVTVAAASEDIPMSSDDVIEPTRELLEYLKHHNVVDNLDMD